MVFAIFVEVFRRLFRADDLLSTQARIGNGGEEVDSVVFVVDLRLHITVMPHPLFHFQM